MNKYTCIIDTFKFETKPLGQAQSITARIKNSGNEMHTLEEICESVGNGQTIVPFRFEEYRSGKILGKLNKYFKGTNLIVLDIDDNMTLDEMIKMHEDLGLLPNAYYKSFSHSNANHKFRVIYCLPFMIEDPDEYRLVWSTFDKFYKEGTVLDKTFDVSRMYYGTNHEPVVISSEPFDIVTLADKLGTLLTNEDYTSTGYQKPTFTDASIIPEEILNNLIQLPVEDMLKSKFVEMFENYELNREGDYHVLRSLMFVYHYMGHFSRFLDIAPRNKSKFTAQKWSHDLKSDLEVGRTGHTETFKILQEIGAFDKLKEHQNKGTVVSNYLVNRLSSLQCYKELGIQLDKYLPHDKMEEILLLAKEGHKVLVIAPTGSGKTYSVIHAMKKLNMKGILSVPNRMNAQQNKETYGIAGAYAGHSMQEAMADNNIISTVWEMLSYGEDIDYHEYILINDEAHAHIHDNGYRAKSIRGVHRVAPRFRGIVDITATPTGLDLTQYTHVYKFEKEDPIDYDVTVYVGFNESSRLEVINKVEGKCLVLENNKKNLAFYENQLGDGCKIVTSDDKETNESFLSIASNERLIDGTKYLLCTSVLTAGVNILDEDITDIVIIGFKNVTTIKQFIARARNVSKMRVHIFISEGSRDWYTFNIYEERAFEASILEKRAHEIEQNIERDLLDTDSSLRVNKLMREGISIEEDYAKLDEDIWRRYYSHLSISNFVIALEEHFSNINVISKKYETDKLAKEFKDLLTPEEVEVDLMNLFDECGEEVDIDEQGNSGFGTYQGVKYCLGYLESLPRPNGNKSYKRLKALYPDIRGYEFEKPEILDDFKGKLSDYANLLGEGASHRLAMKVINEELDHSTLTAQVTASMFLSDRTKWKRNSPAYLLMETIVDRLPKNQEVSSDLVRELCSRIESREFRAQDRFSNTVKEISKVIPIKKKRNSDMYEVGDFEFDPLLDTETLAKMVKVRLMESIDKELRDSKNMRQRWLTLATEYNRLAD